MTFKRTNFARGAAIAGFVLLVSGISATGAVAVPTFPDTDNMYVLGCGVGIQDPDTGDYPTFYNDETTPLNDLQLFSVDPATAVATPIGDGQGANDGAFNACDSEPAWNVVTQTAYFVAYSDSEEADVLMIVDLTTGDSTVVGEISGLGAAPADCGSSYQSMAIGDDGSAFVFDSNSCLYSLDLSTAELTYIGGVENSDAGRYYAQAWSVNPASSVWQVLELYDDFISNVDVSIGVLSATGPAVSFVGDYAPISLEFDSAGTGWVINDETEWNGSAWERHSPLYSVNPESGVTELVADIATEADGGFETSALLIKRPASVATLPNTGLDGGFAMASALAGGILIATGVALMVRRRLI
jgi:hypothetical protein